MRAIERVLGDEDKETLVGIGSNLHSYYALRSAFDHRSSDSVVFDKGFRCRFSPA